MISNQILQNTIDGLKGITRIDLCVINTEGKVLAATFAETENYIEAAETFADSPADSQVMQGCQYLMNVSWNIFCLQTETATMCIWWAKLRHFRSRICWLRIKRDLIRIIL